MRKSTVFTLLFALLFIGKNIFPQQKEFPNITITDIEFTDNLTGYATGYYFTNGYYNGLIFKTTNGGNDWVKMFENPKNESLGIKFLDKDHGWVAGGHAGTKGDMLRTTDAGKSWISQPVNTKQSFNSIAFIDTKNFIAVGSFNSNVAGAILKSKDGGNSWELQPDLVNGTLTSVFFVDSQYGWIASATGFLPYTTDGGQTWKFPPQFSTGISSVFFVSRYEGWASGYDGTVYHSTDGGLTWKEQAKVSTSLSKILFTDFKTGWTAGSGGAIYKTTDGGNQWIAQKTGITGAILSLKFYDKDNAWAVGTVDNTTYSSEGFLLQTADGGITWRKHEAYRNNYFNTIRHVTNLNDSGPGSLRDAINTAEESSVIIFDSTLSGRINLTQHVSYNNSNAQLLIQKNMTVIGPGADKLTISGYYSSGSVLYIPAGFDVSISGLTISEGNGYDGAGIFSEGNLKLSDCIISGNRSTNGGGLENKGTCIAENCTFANNEAPGQSTSDSHGGGIYNTGTISLINCTFDGNVAYAGTGNRFGQRGGGCYGGAIYNSGNMTLAHCTIVRNQSQSSIFSYGGPSRGGALFLASGATSKISNSIISLNTTDVNGSDPNIAGQFTDQGNNIITSDPYVGTLGFNGGHVKTVPLLSQSPAFNMGSKTDSVIFDQRNFMRDPNPDIGAYETNASAPFELLSVSPVKSRDTVTIAWKTKNENYLSSYKIYRDLVFIREIKASASPDSVKYYCISKQEAFTGVHEYGLSAVLKNGREKQISSFPVSLKFGDVKLVSMDASKSFRDVILSWITNGESGVRGYEIYRNDSLRAYLLGSETSPGNTSYYFSDRNIPAGLYNYTLKAFFFDSTARIIGQVQNNVTAADSNPVPAEYNLSQNYPNPFNPVTNISFSIPENNNIKLIVYDLLGKEVSTLADEYKQAGSYTVQFNAGSLPSGIYFYRLEAGEFTQTKKLILLR